MDNNHFFVVYDKTANLFLKKYKHIYYYSVDRKSLSSYTTPKIGSARVYPSRALAENVIDLDKFNERFGLEMEVIEMVASLI